MDGLGLYQEVLELLNKYEKSVVELNSAASYYNNIHEKEVVYKEDDKDVLIKRIISRILEGSDLDD